MMLMERHRGEKKGTKTVKKKMSPPRWGIFFLSRFFYSCGDVHLNIDFRLAN